MSTASTPSPSATGSVLIRFFSAETNPEPHFLKIVKAAVGRTVRRHYKGADPYQKREVLAETIAALAMIRNQGFCPLIVNGERYLYGVARDAIKRVRAKLRPVGQRSPNTDVPNRSYRSLQPVPLEDIVGELAAEDRTEDCLDIVLIISHARGRLRRALELMYWKDYSVPDAARAVGFSESTFRRILKQFAVWLN